VNLTGNPAPHGLVEQLKPLPTIHTRLVNGRRFHFAGQHRNSLMLIKIGQRIFPFGPHFVLHGRYGVLPGLSMSLERSDKNLRCPFTGLTEVTTERL